MANQGQTTVSAGTVEIELKSDLNVCQIRDYVEENPNKIVVNRLKSLLELHDGHSESLGDIAKVVNETLPGYNVAAVHKCLVAAFPDLQAQQSQDKEEIYYLGIRLTNNTSTSEENVIKWLRQRFKEDQFSNLSCQTVREIAIKEIGFMKQNSIGSYVRKAFPNVYTRRSDRLRWYCGITLPEKEITEEEKNRKEWLENACGWLRENMHENVNMKEKCSVVYAALAKYIGKSSIDNSMAAVKCIFPCVVRKTVDRIAYYLGIGFYLASIRESVKRTPTKVRGVAVREPILNDEEQEIVKWLHKVVVRNETHREKLLDIANMMSKKTCLPISEKTCLKYVRKAFPGIFYRKRDGIAHVSGYEIKTPYKPRDPWLQKALQWLHEILERRSIEHWEKYSPILEIMKQGLQCVNYRKLCQILRVAFPHAIIKKTVDGTFVYGLTFSHDYMDIQLPVFSSSDFVGDFSAVDMEAIDEDHISVSMVVNQSSSSIQAAINPPHESTSSSKYSTPSFPQHTTKCSSGADMKRLEEKIDDLSSVIVIMHSEIKGLREELTSSCRQKDNLIVQLQQTLMLLTQQQFQRIVKPHETPQDLSTNTTFINIPTMDIEAHVKQVQ